MMNPTQSSRMHSAGKPVAASLILAMLLASLGTSIANIALPALAEAFAAPFGQVQMIVIAYLASLTITVLITGRLGDMYGRKPMLLAGLAVFGAASLLCAVAPDLWVLTGARAIQGIGAAFLMTLAMALMRDVVNAARLGRAMGLLATASALGTALGPSLGGIVIATLNWQGIFLIQVPLAALGFGLAVVVLPAGKPGGRPARPLLAMPEPGLWPMLAVNFLVAAVMMTTLVVGPFYLGLGLGLAEASAGFVMAIGPVISIFSGIPSGRLVDAWGSGRVMRLGLGLLAAGAILLAFLPNAIGVAGYVLAIMVLTPGYQLFQAANNTAALADTPPDRRGTVSGLLGLSRNIGLVAGASFMGAVFAWSVGTRDFLHATPEALASGMRITFLLAGFMMLAALGIMVRRSQPTP